MNEEKIDVEHLNDALNVLQSRCETTRASRVEIFFFFGALLIALEIDANCSESWTVKGAIIFVRWILLIR